MLERHCESSSGHRTREEEQRQQKRVSKGGFHGFSMVFDAAVSSHYTNYNELVSDDSATAPTQREGERGCLLREAADLIP